MEKHDDSDPVFGSLEPWIASASESTEGLTRSVWAHKSEVWVAELYALRILWDLYGTDDIRARRVMNGRYSGLEELAECVVRAHAEQDAAHRNAGPGRDRVNGPSEDAFRAKSSEEEMQSEYWREGIRSRAVELRRRLHGGVSGPFFENCRQLTEALDLTEVERRIFVFLALVNHHGFLREVYFAEYHNRIGGIDELIDHLLGLEIGQASLLFAQAAPLVDCGLLMPAGNNQGAAMVLTPSLSVLLVQPHEDMASVIGALLPPAPAAKVSLADFAHLGLDRRMLSAFVRSAVSKQTRGANVMIYGGPGVGKTELVRALAEDLSIPLFEVPLDPEMREPSVGLGATRLASLRLAQRLLGNVDKSMLLFDEAEDLFPKQSGFGPREAPAKGMMNHVLESTPTLTFWVANTMRQLDPAHLRRFDLVLRLGVPPRSTRRRIVDSRLGEHELSEQTLHALSGELLTPAALDRLGRVISMGEGMDSEEALSSALRLSAHPIRALQRGNDGPPYDAALCATNHDLEALAQGLRESGCGRLLLHGVPGTGKTAWVRHLADQLDKELIEVQASSLLSMWVGVTEQNMAMVFERATAQEGLLFIDEADSFLRDRGAAHQSWEVTETNELLMQMERFDGILVCATNLLDTLDRASLRRFDLKVEFLALESDARRRLFGSTLESLGDSDVDSELNSDALRELDRIEGLTPGDFASVARRGRFHQGSLDASWLLAALTEELDLRLRQSGSRPVGFG